MTEWRLKNGARLRFLRQYSQRRPVQSRGRPCALQACARSLFKNTNENKSDSITAGDLILAPISNLNPWFALHPGGGPWCGPTRNHFCSCRFPASVQLQLLVGMIYVHWRIAFHAQYLFSRWELRQKSRTAIPEHDYDTHDVGELWLQGGGERLREEMRGEQTRVVICGPSAWKQAEEVRLFLWLWLGLSYSGHMDEHTGKKRSDAQKRVQAEERLLP